MESLPALEDTLLPSEKGDVLELDELWSFAGAKRNQCWLWVALCRRTRQIVAYNLGDRSQEGTKSLREHISGDYRRRVTRSDCWEAYAAIFPTRTHCSCGKQAGENCHIERWFHIPRSRVSRLVRQVYSSLSAWNVICMPSTSSWSPTTSVSSRQQAVKQYQRLKSAAEG